MVRTYQRYHRLAQDATTAANPGGRWFHIGRDFIATRNGSRIAASASALSVLLLTGAPAQAVCTPAAASNVTATCTGATFNQGGFSGGAFGYGDSSETNITINVVDGASNTVTGSDSGIAIRSGTINNGSNASIIGNTNYGILAGGNITVTNQLGGTIRGGRDGIQTYVPGASINLENFGTVTGTSRYGVFSDGTSTVTNHAGAFINGATYGIRSFSDANVTNSGTIAGTTDRGVSATTNATVTNNSGATITGGQYGVYANSGFANVTNSGTITGTGQHGIFAGTNATVVNNSGGSITGTGNIGILANAGGSSVFNAGSISGGTAAIQFAGIGNTLTLAQGSSITGNVLGTGADTFQLGGAANATFDVSQIGPAAQYRGFGTFNKIDSSIWTLTGATTALTPWTISQGTLSIASDDSLGAAAGNLTLAGGTLQTTSSVSAARNVALGTGGGTLQVDTGTLTLTGTVADTGGTPGGLTKSGAGTLTLTGTNTYTGGTTISAGTLQLGNGGTTGSIVGNVVNDGMLVVNRSDAFTFNGNISGSGGITLLGTGSVTLGGSNTFNGPVVVAGGTLVAANATALSTPGAFSLSSGAAIDLNNFNTDFGSLSGAGTVALGSATLTTGSSNTGTTFSGAITGSGGLVKTGTGNFNLTGASSYTGPTAVNGGILSVNGTMVSDVTVNAGGTLGGNGTVGSTTLNGGVLAPGNSIGTLTVQGNLVFTAASTYMVEVDPTGSDRTNVTGTATLGGATVSATFAAGSYVQRQYVLVNATGGVIGTFGGQVITNLPSGFHTSLSTDATNAYLNLTLDFKPPANSGLSANQTNVANALTGFFNRTGGIPLAFGGLGATGLTLLSGENAVAAQQSTFDAMNLFLGLITDPFAAGRGDGVAGGNAAPSAFAAEADAQAYAATGRKRSASERNAYALITKAPPRAAPVFQERWSVWTSGYGGSQTTDGDSAVGSTTTTSRIAVGAVGADYRFSPNTLAGFAMAGGGTNFSVNGLGSGRSDLFQAGGYLRHTAGSAYLTAAVAYGWQDVTTERSPLGAGPTQLRAQFTVNSWSGRVEAGSRYAIPFAGPSAGLTPYVAGQFTSYDAPAYAEQSLAGAGPFALNYQSASATAWRSELGLRTDASWAVNDALLTLRGRAAWARNFETDRALSATFQSLPGAAFVVNGAAPARDAVLTTAAAELKFASGIALAAVFEGDFSDVTRSYAGKGVVRYAW